MTRNEIVPSFDNEELLRMYRQQMSELQVIEVDGRVDCGGEDSSGGEDGEGKVGRATPLCVFEGKGVRKGGGR